MKVISEKEIGAYNISICPGGPQNKSEGKWKEDKYLNLARE